MVELSRSALPGVPAVFFRQLIAWMSRLAPRQIRPEVALVAILMLAWGAYELIAIFGAGLFALTYPDATSVPGGQLNPSAKPLGVTALRFVMSVCEVVFAVALLKNVSWARKSAVILLAIFISYKLLLLIPAWSGMWLGSSAMLIGLSCPCVKTLSTLTELLKYAAMIYFLLPLGVVDG